MATEKVRFRVRRGAQAEWDSINPILADGEIGFAKDTGELRIGDGAARWADRPRYAYFDEIDATLAAALEAKEVAELAATAAQSVVTQDLSAIAAEIGGTATDLFIYDTTKDSDGGAWRKRCQHTSWYNEPLNTATRGARREFPAVAVIVVAAETVTIYDGDDPALPMWMVFNKGVGSNGEYRLIVNGALCLTMRDGLMVFGRGVGLYAGCFIRDECAYANSSSSAVNYGGRNLAQRNEYIAYGSTPSSILSGEIAHQTVNDVAMTVLPDAPIDTATGLPVPTIWAGTNGGVSRIAHDGTVSTTASTVVNKLTITPDGYVRAIYAAGLNSTTAWPVNMALPTGGAGALSAYWGSTLYSTTTPAVLSGNNSVQHISKDALGGISGLMLTKINRSNFAGSMIAYTAADYASGWMVGDTKGAFLASADAAPLVAEELLPEGDFSAGLDGFIDSSVDGGAIAVANGILTMSGASGNDRAAIYKQLSVSANETVLVKVSGVVVRSGGLGIGWDNNDVFGTVRWSSVYETDGGDVFAYLTPWVDNPYFVVFSDVGATDIDIASISVVRPDPDRSAYGNGLIVNGTLTREPVADGAELVAYSGFSADNYLEQPYNADLDFGTGDFCVMGWARGQRSTQCIFDRGEGTSGLALEIYNGGLLVKTGGSYIIPNLSVNLTDGNWNSVAVVRRSGVLSLYANGVEVYSAASSKDVSVASASRVGVRLDGSRHANDLALVRISATAPTAHQIRKIYEDERELFKAGAACTLHGSDSMVKALAYDDVTDLLHVGTSAGRSVFKGLRRIDQADTPVTTAIAASGGMIVEA